MPDVHPSAVIEGDVQLAEDVCIGPGCVLTGPITIGAGTRLRGNVFLQGPLTLGERNEVFPFVCLGFAPQSVSFDPNTPGCGLVIGSDNTFRESVTIHRAMTDEGPTRVGDHNFFMVNSHAGHDCQIGSHGIFANDTLFAGHVTIGDQVITGGHAVVHQFCRIGRGAMIAGLMGVGKDLPQWFLCTGINICGGVNLIGLRRHGFTSEQIEAVRWVYKSLYRNGKSIKAATEDLRQRADDPLVAEYISFIETSSRGICPGQGKKGARHGVKSQETRMSLSFCVLGSGSKGNCTLLALNAGDDTRFALVDCGLSPKQTRLRLGTLGITIEQISDVLVTHLDSDHYNPNWSRAAAAHQMTVRVHHRHRARALKSGLTGHVMELFDEPFNLGETKIEPVLFAHDSMGTAGFVIEHAGTRLGWATDLGRVPRKLLERFTNLHALAIESNYDPELQLNSPRPAFLKQRIMGGSGHLSNEESFRAVQHVAEQSTLDHVVTLHLSQQCNDPRIVKRLYAEHAPHLLDKLTISSQQHPTPILHVQNGTAAPVRDGEQLAMF